MHFLLHEQDYETFSYTSANIKEYYHTIMLYKRDCETITSFYQQHHPERGSQDGEEGIATHQRE